MSRINVNLQHVKRFYQDAETMLKASLALCQGEQAIIALIKKIDNEKQAITELIQNTKTQRQNVTSTLNALKRKILQITNEIKQKEMELSSLKMEVGFVINAILLAALKAKIAALQVEIASLKMKLLECNATSLKLGEMEKKLSMAQVKLERILSRLEAAKSEAQGCVKNVREVQNISKNNTEKAIQILVLVMEAIHKYKGQTIKKSHMIISSKMKTEVYSRYPTRTFYGVPNIEKFQMDNDINCIDLTVEEREQISENRKAFEGSTLYLDYLGVDFDALNNAKSYEEQKSILINKGQEEKDVNQILSIYNADFLADIDGAHEAFYSTSPQTAGDSYEFHRFFVNLREGKQTAKEVPFDLTPYKGRECNFLGFNEKIKNDRRETDVVRMEGNKEIHEELKIGRVYGKEGKAKFRQELYGDDLRLKLFPNQEQEYRIRKNGMNKKCLLDDKEQVRYLCLMQKRHPNRVRVYFNDKLLSLQDLEEIIK